MSSRQSHMCFSCRYFIAVLHLSLTKNALFITIQMICLPGVCHLFPSQFTLFNLRISEKHFLLSCLGLFHGEKMELLIQVYSFCFTPVCSGSNSTERWILLVTLFTPYTIFLIDIITDPRICFIKEWLFAPVDSLNAFSKKYFLLFYYNL